MKSAQIERRVKHEISNVPDGDTWCYDNVVHCTKRHNKFKTMAFTIQKCVCRCVLLLPAFLISSWLTGNLPWIVVPAAIILAFIGLVGYLISSPQKSHFINAADLERKKL